MPAVGKISMGMNPPPEAVCPFMSGPVMAGASQSLALPGKQEINVVLMKSPCLGPTEGCRFWDKEFRCCLVETMAAGIDYIISMMEGGADEEPEAETPGEGEGEGEAAGPSGGDGTPGLPNVNLGDGLH